MAYDILELSEAQMVKKPAFMYRSGSHHDVLERLCAIPTIDGNGLCRTVDGSLAATRNFTLQAKEYTQLEPYPAHPKREISDPIGDVSLVRAAISRIKLRFSIADNGELAV